MMTEIKDENLFAIIIKASIAILLTLTLAGFIFFSSQVALGFAAGGIISIINFIWMRDVLQRILYILPENPHRYSMQRFIVRMSVMGTVIYFILVSGFFSLTGLLAGLSIIVIIITALSLYRALRTGG